MSHVLSGRNMFIWRLAPILKTELGIDGLVKKAKAAQLNGLWIKIADGKSAHENVKDAATQQTFKKLRDALRQAGISVWGWQVPYGQTAANTQAEANIAAELTLSLGLDGLLMDAEGGAGYFTGGPAVAKVYAQSLANALNGRAGLAMCGNDIPSNFPDYPFSTFVDAAQYNAPQVYYGGSPSVANRLGRAVNDNRRFDKPLVPVGAAWIGQGDGGCASASACAERAREFLRLVAEQGFPGCSFWHWGGAPLAFWEVLIDTPA